MALIYYCRKPGLTCPFCQSHPLTVDTKGHLKWCKAPLHGQMSKTPSKSFRRNYWRVDLICLICQQWSCDPRLEASDVILGDPASFSCSKAVQVSCRSSIIPLSLRQTCQIIRGISEHTRQICSNKQNNTYVSFPWMPKMRGDESQPWSLSML